MANIKDVARRAGVGVSTASRVLRGEGYTSADVRERCNVRHKIYIIYPICWHNRCAVALRARSVFWSTTL